MIYSDAGFGDVPDHQQGVGCKQRRLRRINHTSQGEAIEGNNAYYTLMVDQGALTDLAMNRSVRYGLGSWEE